MCSCCLPRSFFISMYTENTIYTIQEYCSNMKNVFVNKHELKYGLDVLSAEILSHWFKHVIFKQQYKRRRKCVSCEERERNLFNENIMTSSTACLCHNDFQCLTESSHTHTRTFSPTHAALSTTSHTR